MAVRSGPRHPAYKGGPPVDLSDAAVMGKGKATVPVQKPARKAREVSPEQVIPMNEEFKDF